MKQTILPLLVLGSLLALGACETGEGPPPLPRMPAHRPPSPPPPGSPDRFDARDFAWSNGQGSNSITGRVALRTKTSGAFTCAGGSVALTPDTPYSAARTLHLYGSDQHAVASVEAVRDRSGNDGAPPYTSYVRSTSCGDDGRFAFHDLPDGGWFLIARAKPAHGSGAALVIMQRVATHDGQTVALDLR
ncbi:MAG TPA: hypothetical protein VG407_14550 [Caulobacteraceae bacterium]|jgi:hypothetical protein|nr:hypothetical protein [Caulobacteraceae bacterium]